MSIILMGVFFLSFSIANYSPPNNWCDYFDTESCPNYRHCNRISGVPHGVEDYPLSQELRDLILYTINRGRSPIACGEPSFWNFKFETFPRAAQMPEIIWDDQLAWIASANVVRCNDTRKLDCLKSPDYLNPGSIILDFSDVDIPWNDYDLMANCRNKIMHYFRAYLQFDIEGVNYFNEKTYLHILNSKANQRYFAIYGLEPDITAYDIKKFAMLISDEVSRVGCAAAHCGNALQIECTFDNSIVYGSQIYRTLGNIAESCEKFNRKYSCLCGIHKESKPQIMKPTRMTRRHRHRVRNGSINLVIDSFFTIVFRILLLNKFIEILF